MNERELDRERAQAVGHAISRCTAAMGGINRKRKHTLFTGVFVRWRDRPFVVTASHCFKDLVSIGSLRVLSSNVTAVDGPPGRVAARGYQDKHLDVAFLELTEEEAARHNPEWVLPPQLKGPVVADGDIVCLRGYPSVRARIDEEEALRRGDVVFVTEVLASKGRRTEYTDIRLEFDPTRCFDVQTGNPMQVPNPEGMSGCGAFALGALSKGEVWSPRNMTLVGIQSSHVTGIREALVVKPVALVRDILDQHYPE